MKWKEPEAVLEVREWRRKMAERYEGLPREEVIKKMQEVGRRYREQLEAEKRKKAEEADKEAS